MSEKKLEKIYDICKDRYTDSIENLLERVVNIGYCPALIFDDNGYWAIAYVGFQSIRMPGEDLDTAYFIKDKDFKPTIREAVVYYFEEMFENE